ncbi:4'-phosphopantetheinyl transferase superfamily protein [Clostridium sp. 'deep sea']|uniref:4'-phosphopantetheinyl transferase family protein n=1 Tax=Clostridium sp. 'deep sea' TaxID=2779445 RepID=UPI0018968893|nr:4'-phosphopantetheinyl transferase superfamily protein [Clostridium sp. 'deep sea']QOR34870.1 4'-phosphopantetheinyl transferase superfamily protein [Clostridium sp. 'deep sea']
MINIYSFNISEDLNKDTYNELLSFLPQEKQQKINKFRFYKDALRSLVAEHLVRYSLKKQYHLNYQKSFAKNEYGKPYLTEYPHIHFNVSHAGNWVVSAISNNSVGIDVEEIKPVDFEIAKRFFAKEEYLTLLNTKESEQLEYFFKIWTLKESYIKAIGKGLAISLDSFSFTLNKDIIEFKSQQFKTKHYFKQFLIDKKHIVALCAVQNNNYQLNNINSNKLKLSINVNN